jgi:hypothetical protein
MDECFIIMPITTPPYLLPDYGNDNDHFLHVLEYIFEPAINSAGFKPIRPLAKGSDLIHAEIIRNLYQSKLVICDISCLNPNVFFELGIRTALNKPVCYVKDNITESIPFDNAIINHHTYDASLTPWILDKERTMLTKHISDSFIRESELNTLWKYFGIPSIAHPVEADVQETLSTLAVQFASLRNHIERYEGITLSISEFTTQIENKLKSAIILPQEADRVRAIEEQERRLNKKIDSLKDRKDLSPEQMGELAELYRLGAECSKMKLEAVLCK